MIESFWNTGVYFVVPLLGLLGWYCIDFIQFVKGKRQ